MRVLRIKLVRHLGVTVIAGVLLVLLMNQLDPFRDYQIGTAAAYLCAAAGLGVLTGLSGQLSLGNGALMAIGAYTVGLMQNAFSAHNVTAQWTLPVSLLGGIVTTAIAGAVIGLAAARLRGPYLAGLTLVVAVAVPSIGTLWNSVFHGDQGISVFLPPVPASLGENYPFERWQAVIALIAALLVMFLLSNLTSGRFGRTCRTVRDDEVAAKLSGIHVARVRVLAFVVSAACAGLGGGVLAVLAQSVSPDAFTLTLSLNLLLAVVVGGLGSLAGAVWGSILLVLLPYLTDMVSQKIHMSPAVSQRLGGNLPLAIFGLLLVIVIIAAPGGVQGSLNRAARWARGRRSDGRPAGRVEAETADASTPEAESDAPLASRS
jgi:branched-chain amino acid transport system permease protein